MVRRRSEGDGFKWRLRDPARNRRLVDTWSLVHVLVTTGLAITLGPRRGFLVATAWEPVEVLAISPAVAQLGIEFGYESWENVVSDIAANLVGAALGAWVLHAAGERSRSAVQG